MYTKNGWAREAVHCCRLPSESQDRGKLGSTGVLGSWKYHSARVPYTRGQREKNRNLQGIHFNELPNDTQENIQI